MTATELIKTLEELVAKYGDGRVFDTIRDEVDSVGIETAQGKTVFFINEE